jgi:hypothetical protein
MGYGGEGRSRVEGLGPDIPASGPTAGRGREEDVLVSRRPTDGYRLRYRGAAVRRPRRKRGPRLVPA